MGGRGAVSARHELLHATPGAGGPAARHVSGLAPPRCPRRVRGRVAVHPARFRLDLRAQRALRRARGRSLGRWRLLRPQAGGDGGGGVSPGPHRAPHPEGTRELGHRGSRLRRDLLLRRSLSAHRPCGGPGRLPGGPLHDSFRGEGPAGPIPDGRRPNCDLVARGLVRARRLAGAGFRHGQRLRDRGGLLQQGSRRDVRRCVRGAGLHRPAGRRRVSVAGPR